MSSDSDSNYWELFTGSTSLKSCSAVLNIQKGTYDDEMENSIFQIALERLRLAPSTRQQPAPDVDQVSIVPSFLIEATSFDSLSAAAGEEEGNSGSRCGATLVTYIPSDTGGDDGTFLRRCSGAALPDVHPEYLHSLRSYQTLSNADDQH
ncbi:hypothetical protein IAR50_001013 [Cryptococcus sp. DSM 104548]